MKLRKETPLEEDETKISYFTEEDQKITCSYTLIIINGEIAKYYLEYKITHSKLTLNKGLQSIIGVSLIRKLVHHERYL